jgi:molybdenum cofactor cytidylyltransferase
MPLVHRAKQAMTTVGGVSSRLEAIVLAAGLGSRFGGAKLTAPWRGGALLDGALAAAFAAPVRSLTVVSGADLGVEPAARAFAGRGDQGERLRIVHAADYASGLSASLRAGVASLPPDADGAFVFLGDMPAIPHGVLSPLAEALAQGAQAAAPTFAGRRGNPVLFSRPLFARLLTLEGDEGARQVLSGLGDALALVPTDDPGVLFDVDLPQDLRREPR